MAFPDLMTVAAVAEDGWGQRGGIDKVLTLKSGKTLLVDEKVRATDWDDFALEYWSDHARKIKGWVAKELACDYIAYAFLPSGRCYLLPFQELRRVWRTHAEEWVRRYRTDRHVAHNNGWETWFVPVPIPIVLEALKESMLVYFEPRPALAMGI